MYLFFSAWFYSLARLAQVRVPSRATQRSNPRGCICSGLDHLLRTPSDAGCMSSSRVEAVASLLQPVACRGSPLLDSKCGPCDINPGLRTCLVHTYGTCASLEPPYAASPRSLGGVFAFCCLPFVRPSYSCGKTRGVPLLVVCGSIPTSLGVQWAD